MIDTVQVSVIALEWVWKAQRQIKGTASMPASRTWHIWVDLLLVDLSEKKISSQLYYASFQCCCQHLKRMNRYSSSKLQDFCIRRARLQYPHPESSHAFSLTDNALLSLTKSNHTTLGIVEFISPLQAVAVTYVHRDSEKRLLSSNQRNIISKEREDTCNALIKIA